MLFRLGFFSLLAGSFAKCRARLRNFICRVGVVCVIMFGMVFNAFKGVRLVPNGIMVSTFMLRLFWV